MTTLRLQHHRILVILTLLILLFSEKSIAQSCAPNSANSSQTNASPLSHQFESGAQWNLCWHIDKQAGLSLSQVFYGPPAEPSTKLIEQASLAQILFKYDEDIEGQHLLSANGLGGSNHVAPNIDNCPAGNIQINSAGNGLCLRMKNLNIMTSVRRSQSLRRHEISLHAFSTIGAQTFEQVWRLSEDGQITPAVRMSGELDRFTSKAQYGSSISSDKPYASNASLFFTWRLDFNIGDTPENDIVEQIEFVASETKSIKRSISTTRIETESGHKVQRNQFRGWLVKDAELSSGANRSTRMGYYIDPQSSGFSYTNNSHPWTQFDLSVTKNNPCEVLASGNALPQSNCTDNLNQFMNDESLTAEDPVVWFSLARQFIPKQEDIPAILTREASFKIIPFDWSATTPFTPIIE